MLFSSWRMAAEILFYPCFDIDYYLVHHDLHDQVSR